MNNTVKQQDTPELTRRKLLTLLDQASWLLDRREHLNEDLRQVLEEIRRELETS